MNFKFGLVSLNRILWQDLGMYDLFYMYFIRAVTKI